VPIDYAFHQIIGGIDDDALKAMRYSPPDEGITVQVFMAYPGVFYSERRPDPQGMQTASEIGSTIMMHAENASPIDVLVQQALAHVRRTEVHSYTVRRCSKARPPTGHRPQPGRRNARVHRDVSQRWCGDRGGT